MNKRKLILAVDFDGTITNGEWPFNATLKINAKESINYLHDVLNCEIIIWTCRCNGNGYNSLDDAISFLKLNDIHYDCINENGSIMDHWDTDCRKIFADFYVDDRNFPFQDVNWKEITSFIKEYKSKYIDCFI